MAAILCQALWKPCELCCKGINRCLRVCGNGCEKCSRCCDNVCSESCRFLSRCCAYPIAQIAHFCEKPFSGTMLLAIFCNVLPFFIGLILGAKAVSSGCSQLGLWLLVQGLIALAHILFTFYVFACMQKPFDTNKPEDANIRARFNHFVCWDPWFAFYIMVAIFNLIWLIIGAIWLGTPSSSCDPSTLSATTALMIVGWVFLGLGAIIFVCSWCCDCVTDKVAYANQSLQRQFEPYRDVETGRRSTEQVTVVQGQPLAHEQLQSPSFSPVVVASAVPVQNETDGELAARLQREEDAQNSRPSSNQQQSPPQPASNSDKIEAAGRTAMWGAKLLGTAVMAAGSAAVAVAATERRRAQEEEAQRRAEAQEQHPRPPPSNFRSY